MRKIEGAPVPLVFPGGQSAGMGEFHETGEQPNTYARFFARYNRGVPLILPGSADAGGQGVRSQVGGGEGHVETTLSPLLMRAAEDPEGNPWGITLDDMSEREFGGGRMVDLTLMDFQALYGRAGLAEAQQRYGTAGEPDKPTPPTIDPEKEALRAKLAETLSERDRARLDLGALKLKLRADVLEVMVKGSKKPPVAAVPEAGGGRYASALRHHKKTLEGLLVIPLLVFLLTGCALLRAVLPGGVKASDIEFEGVKSGAPVPIADIISVLDPRAEKVAAVLALLDKRDALGVLLPVLLVGEEDARWVYCGGSLARKCGDYPLHTTVHFAGNAIPLDSEFRAALARKLGEDPPGFIWSPSRLVADNFND